MPNSFSAKDDVAAILLAFDAEAKRADEARASNRTSLVGSIINWAKEERDLDLDEDAAINILAFHNQVRAINNDMFGASSLAENFATKRKGFSKFAELADGLVDSIPGGSFAKPLTFIAKLVSGKLEENEQRSVFDSYDILNPAHDSNVAAGTSRAIADKITEKNLEKILGCKNEKEARALALKSHAQMLEVMSDSQHEMKEVYKEVVCGRKDHGALVDFLCETNQGTDRHASTKSSPHFQAAVHHSSIIEGH